MNTFWRLRGRLPLLGLLLACAGWAQAQNAAPTLHYLVDADQPPGNGPLFKTLNIVHRPGTVTGALNFEAADDSGAGGVTLFVTARGMEGRATISMAELDGLEIIDAGRTYVITAPIEVVANALMGLGFRATGDGVLDIDITLNDNGFGASTGTPRQAVARLRLVFITPDPLPAPAPLGRNLSSLGRISAGGAHTCQTFDGRELRCWGSNASSQVMVATPGALHDLVAAGDTHTCAAPLGQPGACQGAGQPGPISSGELNLLSDLSAGSSGFTCGLRPAGVICWNAATGAHVTDHPGSYFNLSVGGDRYCAVEESLFEGTCWSSSTHLPITDPAMPAGTKWYSIGAGLAHTCGLRLMDGVVECWGSNAQGQLDGMPGSDEKFLELSVGYNHACAIRTDGTLLCWGSNVNGQATPPAGNFAQISAGNGHTCGIRTDQVRVCWGLDNQGQAPQLALSPGLLPSGTAGSVYPDTQISMVDGAPTADGDYVPPTPTFAVVAGALPAGMSLGASGLLAGTPATAGDYAFTVEAEDGNGFTASREYSLTIGGAPDTTPPDIGYAFNPLVPDGDNSWYRGNVGIDWTIADQQSGIAGSTGCEDNNDILPNDAAGASWTCSATNGDALGTEVTTATIKRDATAPTITAAATTAPNANGWYSGDVTIHYTCSDVLSGVVACPADEVLTASGSSATPTIQDNAGNSATSNAVTLQIDKSAPTIGYSFSPASPDGDNGWYRGDVGIDWTIGDAQSGIAGSSGCTDGTLSSDTSGASWTCTATSNAGLQASAITGTIKRDGTAPTLNPTVPSPLLRGQSYSASPNAADVLSDVATASCGALDTSTTGSKSTTCSATDNAGNSRTVTLDYTVTENDTTPPDIDYSLTSLSPGSNGWYRDDVTITWSVVDPESAATKVGCVDSTLNTDTAAAGMTYSCSASSAGGSTGPVTVTLKHDATDPTIGVTPSPAANANGWNRVDVSLLVACSDATPGSGLASCPSIASVTTEGSTVIPAQQATDNAGNASVPSSALTVKLDKTAPTINAAATSGPDGTNGWYRSDVTVAFTCNDALSGVVACPGSQVLGNEGAAVGSSAQTVSDNAGNTSAASNVVTVKLDKAAPTLAPTVPSPLLRGGSYSASANGADLLSGLASVSCNALDTSSTGSKSITCSATDNAGNSRTVTLNYTVATSCSNDGYSGAQLTWCQNICENGLTGATLDTWIHRWVSRYRELPYCLAAPQSQLQ